MNWSMGMDVSQLRLVALCVVLAIAITGGVAALWVAWRKRDVDEEPLPHCNLEERLSQIASNSMLPAKKSA